MRHVLLIAAPVLLLTVAGPAFSQGAQFPNAANATEPTSIGGPPIRMSQTHHFWPLHRRASYHRRTLRHRPASGQQAS